MTRTERQGIADALTACLPYLWNGFFGCTQSPRQEFICHALRESGHTDWLFAKQVIDNRLKGEGSLCDWLLAQGIRQKYITFARIQAHRKAWVKQLIEEFSASA